MLLTIVREWAQGAHERRQHTNGGKLSRYDDVMLRLHVRACQVTHEIIVLLENGLADGAMARWRTLHEITIVAAIIAKFGDEIAERYVHYQIVESFGAIKAYERDHKALGYKAPSKRQSEKTRKDYKAIIVRFGKTFGEEYGWAARHLGGIGCSWRWLGSHWKHRTNEPHGNCGRIRRRDSGRGVANQPATFDANDFKSGRRSS
jgi:hypothetical protein